MIFTRHIKTARSSLRASRGRSILTIAGIVIGISSVITIISLGDGLRHNVDNQVEQLGNSVLTVRSGRLASGESSQVNFLALLNASTLSSDDATTIAKLPGVAADAPMSFVTNVVSGNNITLNNVSVIGTNQNFAQMLRQKLDYGQFFADSWGPNFAVVGPLIAQRLFGHPNVLAQSITVSGQQFRIAGILAPSSGGLFSVAETDFNSAIFIPMPAAEAITHGHNNVLQILVSPKDGVSPGEVSTQITQALTTAHGQQDFSVLGQGDLLSITGGLIDNLARFITAIAAIALLVAGIGIMDTMLVSVSERTREIGIRKAIGATDRQILNQFLIEGLVISLSGCIIGILVALGLDGLFRLYTSLEPIISVWTVVLAAGVAIAIGVMFSAAPALKAARKDPIEALRHE